MYSIGKLAKMSFITVRTLRYYDEIGLLKPTKTGDGGHRYYDDEALAKLHNIIMLKEMGFELETIHEIIRNQVKSSKELLLLRLEMIKKEKDWLENMEGNIQGILQLMDLEGTNDWHAIFDTISKRYNPKDIRCIWDNYFSEEEIEILSSLPKVGVKNDKMDKWIVLLNDIRMNMDKSPYSSKAQQLGKRWMELSSELYNGKVELSLKAWYINKKHDIGIYDFDPEIVQFIEAAITYYFEQKQAGESQ